ncbi:hypothetical protein BJ741DRAFT_639596 [Chytriomyces cf. hyalinus JEL632]|nr:hypothetical protein BJ741DRAFT_639588 [Chytriomyces cf. hyalinus JEL632]KAI8820041.1 hypothetical protein BJ741DRAFT_639591 [Chytriomyces cf. hyalinus JEL632]KAI8820043.1 hypothetical protein BJ741DRAFT_639596 [Chytriomyces cf. hyalinus JEL632]
MSLAFKEVLALAKRDSTAASESALTELEEFVVAQLSKKTAILKDFDLRLFENKYPRLDSMEDRAFRDSLSHLIQLCRVTPRILEPLLILQVCDCIIRTQQEQLKMQSEEVSVLSVCNSLVSCLSGDLGGAIDSAISGLSSLLGGQGGDCLDRFGGIMKAGGPNLHTAIRDLEPLIPELIKPSSSANRVELFASMLTKSGFHEQYPQQTSEVEVPEPDSTATTPIFDSNLSSSASSDGDTLPVDMPSPSALPVHMSSPSAPPVHMSSPSAHELTDVDAFLKAIYADNRYTCQNIKSTGGHVNKDLFTEPFDFAEKLLREYRGILVRAAAALIGDGGCFRRGKYDVVVTKSASHRIHQIAEDMMSKKLKDTERSKNAVTAALSNSPFS